MSWCDVVSTVLLCEGVMLTQLSHFARRVACAAGLLLCTVFATSSWASTIYELREEGTSAVIGTLEIATPPASATDFWSTTDPSDLVALYLNDSLFDLGTGNLLSTAAPTGVAVLSLDGLNLDIGSFAVVFPRILPIDPLDPAIDQSLSFLFGPPGVADFINLATIQTFPDGSVATEDAFRFGDWEVASTPVPEPGTATLVVIGLIAAAGRIARRKRR